MKIRYRGEYTDTINIPWRSFHLLSNFLPTQFESYQANGLTHTCMHMYIRTRAYFNVHWLEIPKISLFQIYYNASSFLETMKDIRGSHKFLSFFFHARHLSLRLIYCVNIWTVSALSPSSISQEALLLFPFSKIGEVVCKIFLEVCFCFAYSDWNRLSWENFLIISNSWMEQDLGEYR